MMNDYQKYFEKKVSFFSGNIKQIEGIGVSLDIQKNNVKPNGNIITPFFTGTSCMSAQKFLEKYFDDIKNISFSKNDLYFLENRDLSSSQEHHLFLTLLPLAASFKKEHPKDDVHSIFEMTKSFALDKIEKILSNSF
jgi:hypothetical protein